MAVPAEEEGLVGSFSFSFVRDLAARMGLKYLEPTRRPGRVAVLQSDVDYLPLPPGSGSHPSE